MKGSFLHLVRDAHFYFSDAIDLEGLLLWRNFHLVHASLFLHVISLFVVSFRSRTRSDFSH
jgi:hypothetical protein